MENSDLTFEKLPEAVSYLIAEMKQLRQTIEQMSITKPVEKKLPVGIDEACIILKKSKSTVYTLAQKSKIPSYKNGKKLYFYEDELIQCIENGKRKSIIELKTEADQFLQKGTRKNRFY